MRDTFVRTLIEIAHRDPSVMLLTGDLGFGVLTPFADQLPRQFVNVGVAEQNLTGIATGLALSGRIVFTYSIANFPTLRCLEQIRNDACYHNAAVKVVAIGAGFSYGALGVSHHATEDLAILRSLPDLTLMSPGDLQEAEAATWGAYRTPGACYLRLDKSHAPDVAAAAAVVPGAVRCLRAGSDVVLFGTGGILAEALGAADALACSGISCAVYSVHTVKPLDVDGILAAVVGVPIVVTLEEHMLEGGLGSAIAETLADHGAIPRRFRRFALRAGFSSVVGSQPYLRARYGLDAASIAAGVRELSAETAHMSSRAPRSEVLG